VADKAFVIPDVAEERGLYIYEGELEIAGSTFTAGSMLVLEKGMAIEIRASQASKLMLLGGDALEEPRHLYWNFVSSRKERIEQAKNDWRENKFPGVQGDDEYIPLPD